MGLVGLGAIGVTAHLPALQRHPEVVLAGVADPAADRLRAVAVDDDVVRADSLTDLLDRVALDGVVLATPPWVTPELVTLAAGHGLRVLAEKPVAVSVDAAAPYAELGSQEWSRVQVGLTYRHDPAIGLLAELVRSGALGDQLLVQAHIYDEARTDDPEHTDLILRTLDHGSPVIHEGAHLIDWLAVILGTAEDPAVNGAWSMATAPALPTPNLVGATLAYQAGHRALIEFGWFTSAQPPCRVTLLGDAGLVVLDCTTFEVTIQTATDTRHETFAGDRTSRSFDAQLDAFVTAAQEEGPSVPGLDEGLRVLRVCERIAHVADAVPKRNVR